MSHMNTGTSGSVSSMTRAACESTNATQAITNGGTIEASTTCGR
jgi:hypothetical protein